MRDFMIGDIVATFIAGPIVGMRRDENGVAYKVEYEDGEGVIRRRWLYEAEIYHDDDEDDDGGCGCELERAVAALN